MSNTIRILGIDPGLALMGYGVIDTDGMNCTLVRAGVIETTPDMRMPDRLHRIFTGTREILTLYRPDEIAFEELFFCKNVTTALTVGAARGSALCACSEYGKPLYEYTPMQIKQAITGNGRAGKKDIQLMIKLMLRQDDIIRPDDAADGVAAALTHMSAGAQKMQFIMP